MNFLLYSSVNWSYLSDCSGVSNMASENIMKLGFLLSATDKMSRVVSDAVKKSTDKLNAFERATAKIGSGFMKVGGLMTGAGVTLGGAMFATAKSAGEYAEKISAASQKTGIGVVDLQKFAYAAERNNVSFETFTGNITKLNKKIVDLQVAGNKSSNVFKDLGIRTDSINNTLIDTARIFARVPDGAEKTALAMELFGKSGADMIPFLNAGEEGINRLMSEAEKMGLVFSEDAINQAYDFNTTLGNLKNTVRGAGMQIGSLLIPTVEKVVGKIQGVIEKVVAWARENTDLVNKIVKITTALTGILLIGGPVITGIGAIISISGKMVKGFMSVINVSKAVIGIFNAKRISFAAFTVKYYAYTAATKVATAATVAWNGAMKAGAIVAKAFGIALNFLMANPIILIIMGIVAAVAALAFGVYKLIKNWDKVKEWFAELWDSIKETFAQRWEAIKNVLLGAFQWIASLKDHFFEWGKNLIQGLIDGVMAMFTKVKDAVGNIGNVIKDKFKGLLGISSPSKIFAEYGLNITQGLTGGIETGTPQAAHATEGLAMQAVRGAYSDVTGSVTNVSNIDNGQFGGATLNYSPVINISGSGGNVAVDIMQALNSHKSEIARMLREVMGNERRIAFST